MIDLIVVLIIRIVGMDPYLHEKVPGVLDQLLWAIPPEVRTHHVDRPVRWETDHLGLARIGMIEVPP